MRYPLEDVVALVVSRPLGPVDTKQVKKTSEEAMYSRAVS